MQQKLVVNVVVCIFFYFIKNLNKLCIENKKHANDINKNMSMIYKGRRLNLLNKKYNINEKNIKYCKDIVSDLIDEVNADTSSDIHFVTKQIQSNRIEMNKLFFFNQIKLRKSNINQEREYKYIEISNVDIDTGAINAKYIKGKNIPKRGKLIGKKGDILLSLVRPTRGIVGIVPRELDGCIVSSVFVVLTPKLENNFTTEELFSTLKDEKVIQELILIAKGVTTPTLSIKLLKSYRLPLKIKNELIKKIEQMNIKDNIKKENILEGVNEIANNVFTCYKKNNCNIQSNKLKNIIKKIRTGVNISNSELEYNGLMYIRISEMMDNAEIDEFKCFNSYVPKHLSFKYSNGIANKNDLIIPRNIQGKPKSLIIKDTQALINQHLFIITVDESNINPEYLAYYFRTDYAWKDMSREVSINIPTIPTKMIKELLIPTPTINQQIKIVKEIKFKIETSKIKKDMSMIPTIFNKMIDVIECISNEIDNGKKIFNIVQSVGTGKSKTILIIIAKLYTENQIDKAIIVTNIKELKLQYQNQVNTLEVDLDINIFTKQELDLYLENNDIKSKGYNRICFIIDMFSQDNLKIPANSIKIQFSNNGDYLIGDLNK